MGISIELLKQSIKLIESIDPLASIRPMCNNNGDEVWLEIDWHTEEDIKDKIAAIKLTQLGWDWQWEWH